MYLFFVFYRHVFVIRKLLQSLRIHTNTKGGVTCETHRPRNEVIWITTWGFGFLGAAAVWRSRMQTRDPHIPAHGRSRCHRNKVPAFVSTTVDVWGRTVQCSSWEVHRQNTNQHVSAIISPFAVPSAISSSHSSSSSPSPGGLPDSRCWEPVRGTSRDPVAWALWWRRHLWAISGVHISR